MQELKIRKSKLIVNLDDIKYNIQKIKEKLDDGVKIMPVIKADAYGIGVKGVLEVLRELNIDIVSVAIVDEGIFLRDLGYSGDILILNQPYKDEIEKIQEYHLTAGVSDEEYVSELGKYERDVKIHLEIGTGMGRTGVHPYRVESIIKEIKKHDNIIVDGIYTHFSSSDTDLDYTAKQIKSFEHALNIVKGQFDKLRYIHCCNSAGVLNFKEAHFNMVRPGLILYGYLPNNNLIGKIDLKGCCKLVSVVSYVKEVPIDTSISYDRTFITKRDTIVATVPIGYADGVKRCLSNNGNVVINGKLASIIGRVCMDSFMVDVTDIPNVDVGSDVYIWDNTNITIEEIASKCSTISHEILTSISSRVVREYIRDEE